MCVSISEYICKNCAYLHTNTRVQGDFLRWVFA